MAQFVVSDFRNVPIKLRQEKLKGAKTFARRVGFVMAEEANREISERFEKRSFERRRYPSSRRAAGSVSFSVENKDFPFNVDYRVLGGPNVVLRVQVLNDGPATEEYEIESTDISGKEPWALKGVSAPNRFAGRNQIADVAGFGKLAWPGGKNGRFVVVDRSVWWRSNADGRAKRGFLQVARSIAIEKVRAEFK
jgi:hypothetical protein